MSKIKEKSITINEYNYILPEEKIALFPLENRDESKLLIYKNGQISHDVFKHIDKHLPPASLLVFNNSKVINARLKFKNSHGATIEIFCLEPMNIKGDYTQAMGKSGKAQWKCFVGAASKWKAPFLEKCFILEGQNVTLKATIISQTNDYYFIEFSWEPENLDFSKILFYGGSTPLPPYIKREVATTDTDRYQTVYAKIEGSVAAPTAGLHFTKSLLSDLEKKGFPFAHISLHVGAGTFKPVKSETMEGHEMHAEWIDVSTETIEQIIDNLGAVVATGTTALRTLESLYWLGVKSILYPESATLTLHQWDAYEKNGIPDNIDVKSSLSALTEWLKRKNQSSIFTSTQLLITPGYQFRVVNILITNFHQPKSTLLLLIAAAIGENWKKCYADALKNNYRFLSYGDASLIFMDK